MRLISLLVLLSFLYGCQIEDKEGPTPEESFIKYYGESGSYNAKDLEIIYDDSGQVVEGFIVFGDLVGETGLNDYFIMKADAQGNRLSLDTIAVTISSKLLDPTLTSDAEISTSETASKILPLQNGYAFVGTSSLSSTASDLQITDYRFVSFGFLDEDLNLLDTVRILSNEPLGDSDLQFLDLEGSDIIQLSDGNFLLVGSKEVISGGVTESNSYLIKFNDNETIFEESYQEINSISRAFEKPGGDIVLIGQTTVNSDEGENNNNNGANVSFVEVSAERSPFNARVHGLDNPDDDLVYNDIVQNVIETNNGGYVVVGTSVLSNGTASGFFLHLNSSGLDIGESSLNTSQVGTDTVTLQTRAFGITQTINNDFVVVGNYVDYPDNRGQEGMFKRVDQGGEQIFEYESNFGLEGDVDLVDQLIDAVTLPDGKIVVLANFDFGGSIELFSIIKLNDSGSLDDE